MKKNGLISLFLVLAMISSCFLFALPTFAESVTYDISAAQDGSLTAVYEPTTNTLTISGLGEMKNYTSYSSIPWYSNASGIHNVVFDDECGITNISDYMFFRHSNLKSINIPSSVVSIGYQAFYDDSALTEIIIPEGVISIGEQAFSGCENITSISIPSTVETIGSKAFYATSNVSNFTSSAINVEYATEAFGNSTWYMGKTATEKVATVPASQKYLYDILEVYGYEVTLEGTATEEEKWNSYPSNCVYDVGENEDSIKGYMNTTTKTLDLVGSGRMKNYTSTTNPFGVSIGSLRTVNIGEGITYIGDYAFNYYSSSSQTGYLTKIETLNLPSTLTEIGDYAFYKIASETTDFILYLPEGLEVIGNYAFATGVSGLTNNTQINLSEGLKTVNESAFAGFYSKTLELPSTLEYIGKEAFSINKGLIELDIPEGVTYIGDEAFEGCENVTTVDVPSTVEYIGSRAFRGMGNVSDFTSMSTNIDFGTTPFGETKYEMGRDLTENKIATVPASEVWMVETLESIGYNVTSVGTATEEDKWNSYPSNRIYNIGADGDGSNVKAYFNDSTGTLDVIGSGAIKDGAGTILSTTLRNIKILNIHEGITRIGNSGFYQSSSIYLQNVEAINLPSTLVEIGDSAFKYMNYGSSIDDLVLEIPEGVTTIGTDTFYRAYVSSLTLPSTLTSFGQQSSQFYVNDILISKVVESQSITSKHVKIYSDINVYLYSTNTGLLTLAQGVVDSETQIHFLDEPATSGVLDNGIKWTYDPETKTLSFDTTGASSTDIPSYTAGSQPWASSFYHYGTATRYDFGGVSSLGSGALLGFNYGGVGHIDYYGAGGASGLGAALASQTGVGSISYGGTSAGGSQGGGSTDNDNENTGGSTATGIEVYTKDYEETEFSQVEFPDAQPFIKDGIVYTPIRFVNEDLGATVQWNNDTQTATISFYEGEDIKSVRLQPNTNEMETEINGVKNTIELDATIILTEDRLFLPGEEIVKAWNDWEFSKDRSSVTLYQDYYTRLTPKKDAPSEDELNPEDGDIATDENISGLLKTFDSTAIIVNQSATNFKVTVPFVVNVNMDAYANVTTTEGLTVDNKCAWGPVLIKKINVITKEDWLLGDIENEDFINMPVNSKKIGLSINGSPVKTDGTMVLNDSLSSVIKYQDSKELFFDAKLPAQSKSMSDTVAGIIFTLDWDKVE